MRVGRKWWCHGCKAWHPLMPVIAKAITMRRIMDEGVQADAARRIMIGAARASGQGDAGV